MSNFKTVGGTTRERLQKQVEAATKEGFVAVTEPKFVIKHWRDNIYQMLWIVKMVKAVDQAAN